MIHTGALRAAMHDIEGKKGKFWLFGMFMRTDTPGRWDLVVSAPWLEDGKLKAVGQLVRLLADSIGDDSLQEFSRIATLSRDSEFLKFLLANTPVEDREIRIQSSDLRQRGIEEAIIFQAKKPGSTVSKKARTGSTADFH